MISVVIFVLLQCWWGPVAPQEWTDYFGEPVCPAVGTEVASRGQTPENTAHVRSADFLAASVGYSMEPSIRGELVYFTNPAHMAIAEATRQRVKSVPIEARIVKHLGLDLVPFGDMVSADSSALTSTTTEWVLSFSSGAVYQYFIRTPTVSNGRTIVLMHGCGTSAKTTVLGAEEDYFNQFGQLLVERGWTIIVPYVNGYCFMDNQIDKLGQASGVNHLAYEIQGIREVLKHANIQQPLSLYGISKGGVLAGFMAALDDGQFETIIISGHEVIDFLLHGQSYFARPHRNRHYAYVEAWGRYMTTDEWVIDYLKDNPDGRIILEMSTYDSIPKDLGTVVRLLDECRALFSDCSSRLQTIWFGGLHEPPHWISLDVIHAAAMADNFEIFMPTVNQ